jgi:hypothetical protein
MNPTVVSIILVDLIKIHIFASGNFFPLIRELEILHRVDTTFCYNTGGTRMHPACLPIRPIPRPER